MIRTAILTASLTVLATWALGRLKERRQRRALAKLMATIASDDRPIARPA